jgi:hypothetical protein
MVLDHFMMTVKHGFRSIDCRVMLFLLRLVGFADAGKLFPDVSQCETPQPKKDLSRYERVTTGGMAVVGDDVKHIAQCIERELANRWTA